MTDIEDAIDLLRTAKEFRCVEGSIWIGLNHNFSDGHFSDWGVARAVTVLVNAAIRGDLTPTALPSGK